MNRAITIGHDPDTRVAHCEGEPIAIVMEKSDGARVIYPVGAPLCISSDDELAEEYIRDNFTFVYRH